MLIETHKELIHCYLCSSSGRSLVGSKGGGISEGTSSFPWRIDDKLGATSSSQSSSSCSAVSCGTVFFFFFFVLGLDFFRFVYEWCFNNLICMKIFSTYYVHKKKEIKLFLLVKWYFRQWLQKLQTKLVKLSNIYLLVN